MDSINENIEKSKYPIEYMYPNRYSSRKHKTMFKNKINCKEFCEKMNTSEAIDKNLYLCFHGSEYNFLSKLDKDSSEYKKFISTLNENEFICIKVGNDKLLQREYHISNELLKLNIPVFMTHYCILECKDNLCIDGKTRFLDINKSVLDRYDRYDRDNADDCPYDIDVPVSILVMQYIQYSEFGLYVWGKDKFHIVKNCLKHMVMSLLYASYKIHFIHSYIYNSHLKTRDGNLLLGKTDLKSISYGEFGELEIIDGYIPIINDYHNGGFIDYSLSDSNDGEHNHDWMVYLDIRTIIIFFNIRSECKLPLIDTGNIMLMIQNLYTFKDLSEGVTVVPISKDICDKLCNEIDKFDFECL